MFKLLRFLPFLVAPLASLSPAAAQTTPAYPEAVVQRAAALKKTLPDQMIYTIFFSEMAAMEEFADKLESDGNRVTAAAVRDRAREIIQATPEQFVHFRAAALGCASKIKSIAEQERAFVETMPAPLSRTEAGTRPPELVELDNQRTVAVTGALALMRARLGEQGFKVFDYWVYTHVKSHLHRAGPETSLSGQKGGK
jgi:hypothetical protein